MTSIAKRGLLVALGFIVLAAAVSALFVNFDGASARGVAIGAALGIANVVVGLVLTRRSLHKGIRSATTVAMGGFGVRMVLLVTLFLVFKQTTTVDAAAFGLTFVTFFFVYLAAEIVIIEQLRAPGSA
jgi:hypothetical protein